jgi:signal transduction histidine kinase
MIQTMTAPPDQPIHEIRTRLTNIGGYADLMRKQERNNDIDVERLARYSRALEHEAQQLAMYAEGMSDCAALPPDDAGGTVTA